jgi:hypothetical protein
VASQSISVVLQPSADDHEGRGFGPQKSSLLEKIFGKGTLQITFLGLGCEFNGR